MSGHSHFATIKRTKEAKDAAKGKIFSKLGREIAIAVKAGGGPDPDSNYKLRVAMDRARAANMPKDNVERAISKGEGGEALTEVVYEGFAPGGVAVIVEAATDNRNRTAQEMKNAFEKGGGSMGGPGSVAFNFEPRGLIELEKEADAEGQMLKLIDLGVEDMEETDGSIEAYVAPALLNEIRKTLEEAGQKITNFELVQKPKNMVTVDDETKASKILNFLDGLEDNDDVQKVFANLDIPQQIAAKLS